MAEDWPRDNRRRDIYMFLGFVALCLTSVAIVALASGVSWSAKQWAAIAAAGSIAQAAGVVGALVYASRQIRLAKNTAVRHRIETLSDRLESVTHAELAPAAERLAQAWHAVDNYVEFWFDPDQRADLSPDELERYESFIRENYAKARDELWSAYQSARTASNAAVRAMRALGHGRKLVVIRVDFGTVLIHGYMPIAIEDADIEGLLKDKSRLENLQTWTRDFVTWVDKWVERNAPEVEGLDLDTTSERD